MDILNDKGSIGDDRATILKKAIDDYSKDLSGEDMVLKFEKIYPKYNEDTRTYAPFSKYYYIFCTPNKQHVAIFCDDNGKLQVTESHKTIKELIELYVLDIDKEQEVSTLKYWGDCSDTISLLTIDDERLKAFKEVLLSLNERLHNE